MYGLKQSLREWFEKITRLVKKQGYNLFETNHIIFIKHSRYGTVTILIVYVDDIILTGDDENEISWLKTCLAIEFEIKDLESLKYFPRMKVAWFKRGIAVFQ